MDEKTIDKKIMYSRYLACFLCVPTQVSMFFKWLKIVPIDNLKHTLVFLGFLESDYTLFELYDFSKNYGDYIGVSIKSLIITMGFIEVFSFVSILVLFFFLIIEKNKGIKIMGIVSFVLSSTMFFAFTSSVHMLNSSVAEKVDSQCVQIARATPWPYIMLVCSAFLLFTCVFLSTNSIKYVKDDNL